MNTPTTHRADDTGYNNPSRPSLSVRPLDPAEKTAFAEAEIDPEVVPETLRPNEARHALARLFAWGRGLVLAALLALLLFALLAYVAAIDIYLRLETLPLALQIPFWILLGLFSLLLLHVGWRALRLWKRLRRVPQVALPTPLASSRTNSDEEAAEARAALLPYVRVMDEDGGRLREEWTAIWPRNAADSPGTVLASIRELLDPGPVESARWLEDFNARVHRPLLAVAHVRIWHYTKLIGLKTAISPFPLIDALAVLYNSAAMLHDLAVLFNRRLDRAQATVLLGWVVFQTFVASQAQEILESGAEEMSAFLSNNVARASGKIIGARLAEGTVNGLVARRIGRRALRYLGPVR